MPKMKLTDVEVRRFPHAEPGKSYYVMDSCLTNLGVRIHDNRKTWIVRYRGRTEVLGPADGALALSLSNIRRIAERRIIELKHNLCKEIKELFVEHARRLLTRTDYERILASVERELRSRIGDSEHLQRHHAEALTMEDLFARLRDDNLERFGDTRNVRSKLGRWQRYILPGFGDIKVRDFSAQDIEKLKHRMKSTPEAFNAVLNNLREAFRRCARFKPPWRTDNPAMEVDKYPSYPRERIFSAQERTRLLAAIEVTRKLELIAHPCLSICMLTLATGCRPGEPLRVRRDWVEIAGDLQSGIIRFPTQKGDRPGRKRGRILPLGPLAVQEVLRQPAIPGSPFLFPGRDPAKPISYRSVQGAWRVLFRIAGIEGAVPYSARHTAATEAEEANVPLSTASQLLGHHQVQTTHKHYVKPKESSLRKAASALEYRLIQESVPTAEVIREIGERISHTTTLEAGTTAVGPVEIQTSSSPQESSTL